MLHWLKRAGADMQRDKRPHDAAFGQCRQNGIVEMQARRRRGDRPGFARVDRLVARGVVRSRHPRDIRRQRHVAMLVQPCHERPRAGESQAIEPVVPRLDTGTRVTRQAQRRADARRMACAQLRPRLVVGHDSLEQQLDLAARGLARKDAGVDDPRVVEHDEIARAQQSRQVREREIREPRAVDMQQATAAASRRRRLRNQRFRKVEREIGKGQV